MATPKRRKFRKMGRKTLYDKSMVEQTRNLIMMGYTHKQVADFYKVSEASIYLWKTLYPDFSEALDFTKDEFDSDVVRSLYETATGYTERTIKKETDDNGNIRRTRIKKDIAPNIGAIKMWLYNRRPDEWKSEAELIKQKDDSLVAAPALTINYNINPPVKVVKVTVGKDSNG